MKYRWAIIILLAIIVSIVHGIFHLTDLGTRQEFKALDLWFNLRGARNPPSQVAVIALDETSYHILDIPFNQGWPRELHAELLERLAEYEVRRVVFDILFLDASADPEVDRRLAKAISSVPTVLGAEVSETQLSSPDGSYWLDQILEPYDPFQKAAESIAMVGLPEVHGVVRRHKKTDRENQYAELPTLAEAAARHASKVHELPGENDFINYYGPARTIKTYSVSSVLLKDVASHTQALHKSLKGRVVFVGLNLRTGRGPDQKDIFLSPFQGAKIFGTEIHATAAANIINRDWIRGNDLILELLMLSIAVFLAATLIFAVRPQWGLIVVVGLISLWHVAAYQAFLDGHFIPGVTAIMVLLVCYMLSTTFYYVTTWRAEKRIKATFSQYVSPQVVEQLIEDPEKAKLGGEKIWGTALFTDISGFTPMAENMSAEKVSAMLNAYFSEVMDAIFLNHGTVVKFIGDAVFAVWGAPLKVTNHAELAVRTAIEIQDKVKEFNASNRFPPHHTRIGINTGFMVVGNLGTAKRVDYTAIGDAINLASRVENLNRYFGTDILITNHTKKELNEAVPLIDIAKVRVAGKRELVDVATVGNKAWSEVMVQNWSRGLAAFAACDWDTAVNLFSEVKAADGFLCQAAELYLKEIAGHRQQEPPAGWQGELIFSSK